jgi:plastocyanin
MRNIQTSQSVVFTWSALALVAIVSVMTLRGASGIVHAAIAEPSSGSPTEVKIDNFAFTPGVITVKAGTQVTWINHDDIPHTVDSTEGKFKSAAMDTEDKFQFRFTEPGEYPFFCRMHPKMTGKIIVQP